MRTQASKEIIVKMFDCIDSGDFAAMRTLLAPDFVACLAGNDAMNADAFIGVLQSFADNFTDQLHFLESQMADGEVVATRVVWSARHIANFNGVPASQKRVKIEAMAIDRVVDGKIVEHWGISDFMTLMDQIGAVPPAPH